MTSYVSADLRRLVASRAGGVCEYCLIHEDDTYTGCQVDHIISEKHGGLTASDNLAYARTLCNRAKGTDVGSVALTSGEFTRLFNPRRDRWSDHFRLSEFTITSITPVGEATARLLRFNDVERVLEREVLLHILRYPPPEAARMIDV